MLRQMLGDERDSVCFAPSIHCNGTWFVSEGWFRLQRFQNAMMKLDTKSRHDWQGFSKILEVMSFVDEADGFSPDDARQILDKLCQLPPCPGETMSMEEVVFWAGIASGMELARHAEEGAIDEETAEKV